MRITDDAIQQLLRNSQLTARFEFLRNPRRTLPKRRCGGCGSRARRPKGGIDTNYIRRRLVKLSPARLQIIKKALQATTLRVRFRNNKGKVVDKSL